VQFEDIKRSDICSKTALKGAALFKMASVKKLGNQGQEMAVIG